MPKSIPVADEFSCDRIGHNYGGTGVCGKCGISEPGDGSTMFSRTDEIAFLVNVPHTIHGLRVLQISRYQPGNNGCYASATIVALRPDDATYSTHTLIAQDDMGESIRWVIERGHYDIRTLQDAASDALTR